MAAGVITTGSFAKALYPGVSKWYGKAYAEHDEEYPKLFEMSSMTRAWIEEVSVSSFGLLAVRGEGAQTTMDSEQQGFITRYTPTEYSLGFIITRNMLDDDLYAVVGERRAKGLAFSVRQTVETVAANVYNRAFNSSYTGGDGVSLLNAAHVNIAGANYANQLATAADLSEASLEQARIDLMKFTNDRGLKISIMPKSLIVPVDLVNEAEKILKTPTTPFSAELTVNVAKGIFPGGLIVNHYLTDTDAWFIRTNSPDGMKFMWRKEPKFDTDNDFLTDNAQYKVVTRFVAGWTDPRGLFGSAGA